jgi:hypothetical protein
MVLFLPALVVEPLALVLFLPPRLFEPSVVIVVLAVVGAAFG